MTCKSCLSRWFLKPYTKQQSMYYIQYLYQHSHQLQFKVTKTSITSFRTHDFDSRHRLDADLYWTADSTYTLKSVHHTISSIAILRWWRCAGLHSGGTHGPVWFGAILRYQPPKLSWRRRQHDAFRSLVYSFNVRFPTTLTFPGNLCYSRPAAVRDGHTMNHKLCPAPRPGVARG